MQYINVWYGRKIAALLIFEQELYFEGLTLACISSVGDLQTLRTVFRNRVHLTVNLGQPI
jgi:hypothetical protein